MHMTIPKLVDRLRCFVVWFDSSEAEILIDGKSIKSFDYELEDLLPPDGFDRRMVRLNISTVSPEDRARRDFDLPIIHADDDATFEGAKKKEKEKWDSEKESRDECDREMELWEKFKATRE